MLDDSGLSPADAAEIGYVDEVLPADELLDRALARATHLAKRLEFAAAAVKRAAYIGGSLSLEDGLHVENAEFISALASPGAQAAMLAYMERTAEIGDLPLYDRPTYERTLAPGRFSGGEGRPLPRPPPPPRPAAGGHGFSGGGGPRRKAHRP